MLMHLTYMVVLMLYTFIKKKASGFMFIIIMQKNKKSDMKNIHSDSRRRRIKL